MPVITIYGIPDKAGFIGPYLTDKLKQAVSEISELEIGPEHISVLYPRQHPDAEHESDIIAYVDIFDRPRRTDEVRQRLAEEVCGALAAFANNNRANTRAKLIEVFIRPLQEEDGFSSAREKDGEISIEDD